MNMCLISLMELLIGNKYFGAPHLFFIIYIDYYKYLGALHPEMHQHVIGFMRFSKI
jgi:hypothetical protein